MIRQTTIALAATLLAGGAFAQNASGDARTDQGASQQAKIWKNGSRDGTIGDSDKFTGTAYVEPVFPAEGEFSVNAGKVTFLPGARANWHTHPVGQMLIVTQGKGWYQIEGKDVQVMQAGDVVWFPANLRHWHGATDRTAVTHYAVQEFKDGKNVVWGEPVSDEEFARGTADTADGADGSNP